MTEANDNFPKANNKVMKFLIVLSIAIPFSIVLANILTDGKELILKSINWIDYQLLDKVNAAIISLQEKISQKEILTALNEINYYKKKQNVNKPLQVYDKLVFNIHILNVNPQQPPIHRQRLLVIEQLVIKHFQQHSYIKDILQARTVYNYDKQQSQQSNSTQGIIKISIKPSHISQIDPNYQTKVIQLYQQLTNKQHNNNNKASQYYIDSIMKQLRNTNQQKYCHYLLQNTRCKEHMVYVLYSDGEDVEEMVRGDIDGAQENWGGTGGDQGQYWATEDHRETLIVLPIRHSLIADKSLEFLNFLTTIEQLIYESLDMSQLILHTHKHTHQHKPITQSPPSPQDTITQLIQLHSLHKQLHILHQLHQIVNNTAIPYTRINNGQRQQLMNNLSIIARSSFMQNCDLKASVKSSNYITMTTINMVSGINTFPTDYKLGALAPVAIIIIYPLLNLMAYLRK